MQLPSLLSNAAAVALNGANGAWSVVKTKPLSTLFATGAIGTAICGAWRKDDWSGNYLDGKMVAAIGALMLTTWIGLLNIEGYLLANPASSAIGGYVLANPVSSAILGYEAFRIGHNNTDDVKDLAWRLEKEERAREGGEECENPILLSGERLLFRWNRFGLQDLGIVLTAALVRFGGPKLFNHRLLTWVR